MMARSTSSQYESAYLAGQCTRNPLDIPKDQVKDTGYLFKDIGYQFKDTGSQFNRPCGPKVTNAVNALDKFMVNTCDPEELRAAKRSQTSSSLDSGYHSGTQVQPSRNLRSETSNHLPPLKKALSAKQQLFVCSVCQAEFKRASDWNKHILRHTRPHHCDFASCIQSDGFSNKTDLERHKRTVHGLLRPKDRQRKCFVPSCPKKEHTWSRRDNFEAHVVHRHGLQNMAWCREASDIWWTEQSTRKDERLKSDIDSTIKRKDWAPLNSSKFMETSGNINSTPASGKPQPKSCHNVSVNLHSRLNKLNVTEPVEKACLAEDEGIDSFDGAEIATTDYGDSYVETEGSSFHGHESLVSSIDVGLGLGPQALQFCEEIGLAVAYQAIRLLIQQCGKLKQCVSTENTNTASSSYSGRRRKTSTNITPPSNGSKRQRSADDGNDEEETTDNGRDRELQGGVNVITLPPKKKFACPFNKAKPRFYSDENPDADDAKAYRNYENAALRDISTVKLHCKRVHSRPEFYCPRCYEIFKTEAVYIQHCRRDSQCTVKAEKYGDRMTKIQREGISAVSGNDRSAYLRIFKILLPNTPVPESVYQDRFGEDSVIFGWSMYRSLGPTVCLWIINDRCQQGHDLPILEEYNLEIMEQMFQTYLEETLPLFQAACQGNLSMETLLSYAQRLEDNYGQTFVLQRMPQPQPDAFMFTRIHQDLTTYADPQNFTVEANQHVVPHAPSDLPSDQVEMFNVPSNVNLDQGQAAFIPQTVCDQRVLYWTNIPQSVGNYEYPGNGGT